MTSRTLLALFAFITALMFSPVGFASDEDKAKEEYERYLSSGGVYSDKKLTDYVERIGERIVKVAGMPDQKFTFTVLDFPDINAYAAPGGYIYINRGLINHLHNEAQLAAVLAHEVAHITRNHYGRTNRARLTNTILANTVGILTGSGDLARASSLWGQTVVSGYGRDMELEADQTGAEYLRAANYPPSAMIEVIATLKDQQRFAKRRARETGKQVAAYHGLFASHPRSDKRLQELVESAGKLDNPIDANNSKLTFRLATDGLPWGKHQPSAKQPDNRYQNDKYRFYFDYPEGWSFKPQGKLVVGTNSEQDARMTVQVLRRTTETPDVYIRKRLGYPIIKKSEPFSFGRVKGHLGFVTPPEGGADQRIGVLYYRHYAYVFRGEARQNNMATADKAFRDIITSFRPAPKKRQTDDKAIHYVKAKPGVTYEKLAAYLKLGKYGEEELRLINGHHPVGEPKPGEWVKIIR